MNGNKQNNTNLIGDIAYHGFIYRHTGLNLERKKTVKELLYYKSVKRITDLNVWMQANK